MWKSQQKNLAIDVKLKHVRGRFSVAGEAIYFRSSFLVKDSKLHGPLPTSLISLGVTFTLITNLQCSFPSHYRDHGGIITHKFFGFLRKPYYIFVAW